MGSNKLSLIENADVPRDGFTMLLQEVYLIEWKVRDRGGGRVQHKIKLWIAVVTSKLDVLLRPTNQRIKLGLTPGQQSARRPTQIQQC